MTPQQLKDSILQLAVEGKLVPQIESEGNAEDLYNQIQKEKAQLIKEGKIKKEKPLAPITEEEIPFDIPSNWKWVRWGNISNKIQYGYNASAESVGSIRMVRISDIENNNVKWNSVPFCSISDDDYKTYKLEENDILFARTGGTVGKSFLVSKVPYDSVFAGYLIRTQYSNNLSPQFLKLFMESKLYWTQLHNGTIATAQPNCNGQTLSKMILPLPPLAEQKRIVEKIEELLPLVDKYGEAYNQLSELEEKFPSDLKKSILQYAMEGKLVPQIESEGIAEDLYNQIQKEKALKIKNGEIKKEKPLAPISEEEIPFDIPQSWKWVRLGEICKLVFSGKSPIYDTMNRNYMCLGQASNKEEGIDYSLCKYVTKDFYDNSDDYQKLQYGDVLLNTLGGGTVGRSGIFDKEELSDKILTDGHLFVFRLFDIETAFFLLDYLRLNRANIEKNAEGSTNQCFLKKTEVSKYVIPLPPLAEQKRIVDKIEELFSVIDSKKS